jgi:hypothetical protein
MVSGTERVIVHVRLLGEGTDVSRPAPAMPMGNGLFRLLPTDNYDPEDEKWEFPPGSVVETEERTDTSGTYRLAIHRKSG